MKPTNPELLIDRAAELNKVIENSYLELALTLVEIKETEAYKFAYQEFDEYYQKELGRNKSTISQLLTVGRWIKENGLLKETKGLSYRKLYISLTANPEKPEGYIIAAAQTNTLKELEAEAREKKHGVCTEHTPVTFCSRCHARIT